MGVAPIVVAPSQRSLRLVVYGVALASFAASRLWMAWSEHGIFYPDEVYQSLEQGHRLAFGYGIVPWEFREGARSWVFPGAIGLLMELGSAIGLSSGVALARLVKCAMALGSVFAGYAAMRIAERIAGLRASIVTAGLYLSFPIAVYLGSRAMSDVASAPLAAAAVLLLGERDRDARSIGAGAACGLAILLRYQNGLLVVLLAAMLFSTKRTRDAWLFIAGAAALGLVGGAIDWATWGAPFRPLVVYVRFALKGGNRAYGSESFDYYFRVLWTQMRWPWLVVLAGLARAAPRAKWLTAVVLVFVLVHCFVPLKQMRFLVPVVPLALALSGTGIALLLDDAAVRLPGLAPWRMSSAAAASIALSAALASALPRLSYGAMGDFAKARRSAWGYQAQATLLLSQLGQMSDLCGVILPKMDWGFAGGYTYLHRDVPLFRNFAQTATSGANYAVAVHGTQVPNGFEVVETRGEFELYRRSGECVAPPEGYSRNY
jgi:phosphatidylinositol glycan class B